MYPHRFVTLGGQRCNRLEGNWRCGSLGAAASVDSVPSRVRWTAPLSAVVLVKIRCATPDLDIDLRFRTLYY